MGVFLSDAAVIAQHTRELQRAVHGERLAGTGVYLCLVPSDLVLLARLALADLAAVLERGDVEAQTEVARAIMRLVCVQVHRTSNCTRVCSWTVLVGRPAGVRWCPS